MSISGLDTAQSILQQMAGRDRQVIISNGVPYAPLVQGDEQVAIHRGRWVTVAQAVTEIPLEGLGNAVVAGQPIEPELLTVGRNLLAQLQREPAEIPGQRYRRTHQLRGGWTVGVG